MIAAGSAIRLGFTQAGSRWATVLFAALASIAEVFAGTIATLGFVAWLNGAQRTTAAAFSAALAGLLAARIMLALVCGGAVRQSSSWLKGQGTGSTLEEIVAAAPRSLAWFAWTVPIDLLATLWKWVGVAALVFGYGRALAVGHGGCPASLATAAFVVLALPLAICWAALRRATLVHAVRNDSGAWRSATAAMATLLRRPGAFAVVLGIGLVGAAMAEGAVSSLGNVMSPDTGAFEASIATQLAVGLVLACVSSVFELFVLYGFTALEGDAS